MLKINLWNPNKFGSTLELISRDANFGRNEVIVFVKMHHMPNELLRWITDAKIQMFTWFDEPVMRLFIPVKWIESIKSYSGPVPMYVPNPDLD